MPTMTEEDGVKWYPLNDEWEERYDSSTGEYCPIFLRTTEAAGVQTADGVNLGWLVRISGPGGKVQALAFVPGTSGQPLLLKDRA